MLLTVARIVQHGPAACAAGKALPRRVVKHALLAGGIATALSLAACSGEPAATEVVSATAPAPGLMPFEQQNAIVGEYCVTCHNYDDFAGGFELTVFQAQDAAADSETAEKMIRKLRAGMMPPAGEPRPDFETAQALAAALEASIDAHADYHPAAPGLHRLNRTEYANVIRDLVALEVDVETLLPSDDSSNGFDNQAGALGLSPVLLEAYLSAASKIAEVAVGAADTPSQTVYRVPEDTTQNYHVEGLPFGTRGGALIEHNFPVDGEYAIKVFAVNLGNMGNFRPFGEVRGEQLEVLIDGERVGLFDWDVEFGITPPPGGAEEDLYEGQLRTIDLTVPVTAGPHQVGVTFLASNYAPGLDLNNAFDRSTLETGGIPGFTFYPHVGRVRIDGPMTVTGPGDAPSRHAVFSCQPATAAEEPACAEEIVGRLARLAYRGDATPDEIATLLEFYAAGRAEGDFTSGIEAALQRMLSDPKFIYRVETPPADVAAGETYAISDLELASRLSFFLWSSMPDDELLSLAEAGRLRDPGVLEAQVSRMLADRRSVEFTENFAGQWLALRNLEGHVPIASEFPDFDDNLRQAFRRETELFFDSLIREDRSVFDLLTADYTFVNERLARHYGIPGVRGSRFRRIELAEFPERHGILGKGSLLTVTSQPGRTSPVIRGNWVLGKLIGTPAPDPPPDVPDLKPQEVDAAGNTRMPTMREQLDAHRADPACAGCHRMMDPIGFSLEPFDATGRLRAEDSGQPIDPTGVMYDGSPINGPQDLRDFIIKYDDAYVRNIAENMLTYAVGRGMDRHDMPIVRSVAREAAEGDYRFHALITAVVESPTFQMNTKPLDVAGADAGSATPAETAAGAGAG